MYRKIFKRLLDVSVSLLLLILLAPLLLALIFLLFIFNKGTPFFFQGRPGYKEKKMFIIKFKTMNEKKGKDGNLLSDTARLTKIGKILRKTSLDELPQLINVLKGDMSLIGPRPLLFKYIDLYSAEQRRRHDIKPGITGLAQVNGRNGISWKKKFEYDIYYVNNNSFWLDLKITWLTIMKVIKMDGVNQTNLRPMKPFNGDN